MLQLKIIHEFKTSVSHLFKAWTEPEMMKQWFAPGNMTVASADADARQGGSYRIIMQESDGSQHIVSGKYHEIICGERIDFSWKWHDSEVTTRVIVVFKSCDNNHSSIDLTHLEFIDQDSCDKHRTGWNGCLANLQQVI